MRYKTIGKLQKSQIIYNDVKREVFVHPAFRIIILEAEDELNRLEYNE
jgi:hypothetical protein